MREKRSPDTFRLICENTSDLIAIVSFSANPVYLYLSPSHKKVLGYDPAEMVGKHALEFVHPEDRRRHLPKLIHYIGEKVRNALTGRESEITEKVGYRVRDARGDWRCLEGTFNLVGNQLLIVSRDVTELKRKEAEREKLISDLREALARIRTLKGLIPICAQCKKIRDDKGYWTQVENYIRDHTDAELSHGLCPDCVAKLYPDFAGQR